MQNPLDYIRKTTDLDFLIKLRDVYCPIDRENANTDSKRKTCDIVEQAVNTRISELQSKK